MSTTLENVELWSGKGRSDENFPVGVLVSPRLRAHVHAFYQFARNADDIADSPELTAEDKIARLDLMEDVLMGRAEHGSPSALGLRASLAQTGVNSIHARELLIAFRQDAVKHRYANWPELHEYCRYSAMPVGRYVLELHGERVATWGPSDELCTSLQILNHLQDGAKDLRALDRCYLPEDLMRKYGAKVADLLGPAETPGLRALYDAMLRGCDNFNHIGRLLPPRVHDRRLRLETAVIGNLAHRLTDRLRRGDPVATRVKLARVDVVTSVLRALRYLP